MSAHSRGRPSRPDDFYETPSWCTELILPKLNLPEGARVLDPGAGKGGISKVLTSKGYRVAAVERNPQFELDLSELVNEVIVGDFLSLQTGGIFDAVVGNPPYTYSLEFAKKAIELTAGKVDVAFLLRVGWLASKGRVDFHLRNPSDVFILPERPSFTENGKTDQTDYAWFVWGPGRGNRWYNLGDSELWLTRKRPRRTLSR